jgi:hydrogenase maturation protease
MPSDFREDLIGIGLGNILLQDEGVGVHVIQQLQQRYLFVPDFALVDGGTLGLDLLPYLENKEQVLFVDAVDFQREPGYVQLLKEEEIQQQLNIQLYAHQGGLASLLNMTRLLGTAPSHVTLLGIQPASLAPGLQLSPPLAAAVEKALQLFLAQLDEWNVQVQKSHH